MLFNEELAFSLEIYVRFVTSDTGYLASGTLTIADGLPLLVLCFFHVFFYGERLWVGAGISRGAENYERFAIGKPIALFSEGRQE